MNVCAYCGRENDDALTHCGGCGTKLLTAHGPPAEEEEQGEGEQIEPPTYDFINLGEVAAAFVREGGFARRLLSFCERATEQSRDFLGEGAWGSFQGIHLVLLFSEEDDYYQYISAFYPEGTHPTTSGVHLSAGFPHIAALHYSELQSAQIIAHELAHHCLSHLTLPRWLDEGVAMTLERAIGRSHRPVLPDDLPIASSSVMA